MPLAAGLIQKKKQGQQLLFLAFVQGLYTQVF
jgi:hypothetical protein